MYYITDVRNLIGKLTLKIGERKGLNYNIPKYIRSIWGCVSIDK